MVQAAPNALILINENNKITFVNHHAEWLFKYSSNEIIGQDIKILIPEKFRHGHPLFIKEFFSPTHHRKIECNREDNYHDLCF